MKSGGVQRQLKKNAKVIMRFKNTRVRSGPGRKNLLRRRNLFGRTSEIDFVFSSSADDMHVDGFQTAVLHSQAELFIDFPDVVLLEAFVHD